MTIAAIQSTVQIAVQRLREPDGIKDACQAVDFGHFWANHFSKQTGYKPSAEFDRVKNTSVNTKNVISTLSVPGELYDMAGKANKYWSLDAASSPDAEVEKRETGKALLQQAVGVIDPLADSADLWDTVVCKLSEATKELFSKISNTALAIFMGWKAKDEVDGVVTNYKESLAAAKSRDTEKSERFWQWVKLGVVNTAKYISYLAFAVLKLASHFGGHVIAPWAYIGCLSAGLILGTGGHFYSKVNELDKNPALKIHHDQAVAAVAEARAKASLA
jgi:hypothetical protein